MTNPLVTILYYTSNREKEPFASKIRENILKFKGDLPLVSVSQKPLENFGHNICVGEKHPCYFNEFRQIQIGLKEVKTPFVLHAEADFLYPPEYFQFVPPELRCYRYDNVWIVYKGGKRYYFKGQAVTGAEINHTETWLNTLNEYFKGRPEWLKEGDRHPHKQATYPIEYEHLWGGNPAISFKTKEGIRWHTQIINNSTPQRFIPYWGSRAKLEKEMFG
jgi:hypothetical protein